MDNKIKNRIADILNHNNIEWTSDIHKKLEVYYSFLVEYNKNVNLTSIVDVDEVYLKHFADCMLGANIYRRDATLCDIGTGAGFPGIVLKIIRPDLKVVLVDSLQKRIDFLNLLIEKLNLKDIKTIHSRAEDEKFKTEYLNTFDYVVARAVANLTTLTEYCLPFVKVGGNFVAYKSDNIDDEINDAKKCIEVLGGAVESINNYSLTDDIIRKLIVISKQHPTSSKYPRSMNKPRLKPLR